MARLDRPQDPLFARINASIGFDRRLWPQDIQGSVAHARALERAGVIDAGELAELERGLAEVARELEVGELDVSGDEDIHMAVERRLTELVGPLGASSTRAGRATTRSRPTWRCTCASAPSARVS